jgi:hypothetical protein
MPKLVAEPADLDSVVHWIRRHPELAHLRAKRRADVITIVSGPEDDAIPHARLRRSTKQWWNLELADHAGRWEPTHVRASILATLEELANEFPWALTPRE